MIHAIYILSNLHVRFDLYECRFQLVPNYHYEPSFHETTFYIDHLKGI